MEAPGVYTLSEEVKCPEGIDHRRKPAVRQVSVGASRVGRGQGSSCPGARDLNTERCPWSCKGLTLSVILIVCSLS